ncbi:MAG: FAD-dependent oxidoreductase [Candidatus Brocadiia bacterium]|nr:FAD-dependent oxidoreductase [Candidatus Brocadiia bacterium]
MAARATADVVIVGAGIAGCAVAYELTRLGVRPLIVEREGVASGASGGALGDLNTQTGAGLDGPLFALARTSLEMHGDMYGLLREETGFDSALRMIPSLMVAMDDSDVARLRAEVTRLRGLGFESDWLTAREVRALEPSLSPETGGAVRTQGMGMLAASVLTTSLLHAAEGRGATLRHGEVRGLEWDGDRVVGVTVGDERVSCGSVVLAVGPWSARLGAWLGTPVPVRPVKGQIVQLRVPGAPVGHYISWDDTYAVSKEGGLTWTGTTMEEAGFDVTPTLEVRDDILRRVHRLLSGFAEAEVVRQTACLRPVTDDGLPIMGAAPTCRGVYVATGGGRKGILLGPVMGKAVADLVVHGATDLPIEPLGLDRFATG